MTWPDEMTVGKRHLVEVDLKLVTETGASLGPDDWPLPAEEYVYTCLLDGDGFDQWALRDNKVLVHRFGGCYAPAQFVVKPENAGVRSLWLTILNAGSVPVGSYELDVVVVDPPERDEDPGADDRGKADIEVGISPANGQAPPDLDLDLDLDDTDLDDTDLDLDLALDLDDTDQDDTDQDSGSDLNADSDLTRRPDPDPDASSAPFLVNGFPARQGGPPQPDFKPAPGYDPDSDPDIASIRVGEQATIDIPYDAFPPDLSADLPADTAPFVTIPDIPYPDSSQLPLDDRLDATRRDEQLLADDAATRPLPSEDRAPVRRDQRRPAVVRLTEWYSLLGLRRSRNGSLHSEMLPLFSPGAARGDRVAFTARCAPSDEYGTVFSVMGESEEDERPKLRSTQAAKVPPGIYRVTAELVDPSGGGQVRFNGLPQELEVESRPWREILGKLPARVPDSGPAHLIAAIEISGPDNLVRERIESVRRLFTHVSDQATDFVCYSVITYGPHSVNYNNLDFPEVPVAVPAWAETADDALHILDQAARRGAAPVGYEYAAQLECVLVDLNRSITGAEGRPVIVTVGGRPAHPRRVDPRTEIIPCRYRNDWAAPLARLRSLSGIGFGSIRDSGDDDQLWSLLGETAAAGPAEIAADFGQRFARDLGLTSQLPRLIPFPMFSDHPALRQVSPMP